MNFPNIIQRIAILTPPILLAVTVHEMAHGWVAYLFGDPTARSQGRLTLNPLRHLDPIGTLVFFLTQTIGWAKPVPVNPSYFKDPKRDMIWVSLAGPGANVLLAVASAFVMRQIPGLLGPSPGPQGLFLRPLFYMAYVSIQINVGLAVFNLIPIPPLDGSKVLIGILPHDLAESYQEFERYGFLLILLLVFTGVIDRVIVPVIIYIDSLLLGTVL
ncbi:MAG: site-2 protease family protein [Nitrospiraceae bacterium]|nr:site-2 protease family protein [Nitrospiraceae bacterium]